MTTIRVILPSLVLLAEFAFLFLCVWCFVVEIDEGLPTGNCLEAVYDNVDGLFCVVCFKEVVGSEVVLLSEFACFFVGVWRCVEEIDVGLPTGTFLEAIYDNVDGIFCVVVSKKSLVA